MAVALNYGTKKYDRDWFLQDCFKKPPEPPTGTIAVRRRKLCFGSAYRPAMAFVVLGEDHVALATQKTAADSGFVQANQKIIQVSRLALELKSLH